VVTPGSPTYVYDACLRTDDLDFADSRPYVGVAASAGGYTMVEVRARSALRLLHIRTFTQFSVLPVLDAQSCSPHTNRIVA
jgi:hypothetical protein